MALLRLDHVPETVKVNLPLYIILPGPGEMGNLPVSNRKVLYLLHGINDDASAWQRYTMIEPIAKLCGLVVIMPSVGRSFYTDQPNGQHFFSYLTIELPRYLKDVFGLSPPRANTFIAGNSMGGYGAFKAAFLHPELYAAAASFSGAFVPGFILAYPNDPRLPEFEVLFGDLGKLVGSQHDSNVWIERAARDPAVLPRLFMACGRQEDVLLLNRQFQAACQEHGIPVDYHEEDGKHDWFFWNKQIQRFLSIILKPE